MNPARPIVHLELRTPDPARACAFYARMFGWRAELVRVGSSAYLALDVGGPVEGGVVAHDVGRASWLPYVAVADVVEATERARALDAAVTLAPREGPAGWRSVLTAPGGAQIALWQSKTAGGSG